MALPGIDFSSIETISSHPMALLQCKDFLKTTDKTIIESKDTAEVARMISDEKISTTAAIASPKAAEIYGLDILMSNIQTISYNETRFVFISNNDNKDFQDLNKASLKIILSHESGSLAKILNIFNDYNINLTKVQSIPVIKTPWKYSFFIDLTFNKSDAFIKAIELVKRNSEFLKIFGIYKSFKK
ncbi:MAG: prephenate dehydratase, partial [Flavobacteriaceae bacterium]